MTLMKITILHSMIGVASAAVIAVAVAGNVVGQTAAPPAGLPPVSPAPALAEPAITPSAPLPSPAKTTTPPAPVGVPGFPAPTPAVGKPRAVDPAGIPGAGAAPGIYLTEPTKASEVPIVAGGAAPAADHSFKGEYVTREWKVSADMFDDGHGGTTNAKDILQRNGVTFGQGASAKFSPENSVLVVRNTPEQLKLVEGVISPWQPRIQVGAPGSTPPLGGTISVGGGKSGRGARAVLGTGLAPSAVNNSVHILPPTPPPPPRAGAGIAVEGVSGIGASSVYAGSGEFPVTSVEVGRAHLAGELNHDPQASVSRYAAIVANFDAQRQAAATAVYGLGEAYRKMGRNVEARVQYARVLREFVDFPELARQSQRQLSTTSNAADPDSAGGISGGGRSENVEEERALLREELELLEGELARTQDRIKAGVEPTSSGLQLQRDILRLKQQLVRLPRSGGGATPTPNPAAEGADSHDSQGGAAGSGIINRVLK
jgi:hypothetical protein